LLKKVQQVTLGEKKKSPRLKMRQERALARQKTRDRDVIARSPNTLKSARLVEEGVSVRYYCIEAEIIDIRVSSVYLTIIGNGTFLPHLR